MRFSFAGKVMDLKTTPGNHTTSSWRTVPKPSRPTKRPVAFLLQPVEAALLVTVTVTVTVTMTGAALDARADSFCSL
jgi:hypothetical protein